MSEPHLVVTKLALLKAAMLKTKIERVQFQYAIGSCPGILTHPAFRVLSVARIDLGS